jgi:hypothetical protein
MSSCIFIKSTVTTDHVMWYLLNEMCYCFPAVAMFTWNTKPLETEQQQQERDDATAGFPPCVAATSCCNVWLVLPLQRAPPPQRLTTTLPIFGAVQQPGRGPSVRKVAERTQCGGRRKVSEKHPQWQDKDLVGRVAVTGTVVAVNTKAVP